MRLTFAMTMLAVLAAIGCSAPARPAPAGLSADDRAAIEAASRAWAEAAATDWAKVVSFYAEDAVVLPPNAPEASGRAAIAAVFGAMPPADSLSLTNVEIEGVGDLAYVRGRYTMTFTPEGGEPVMNTGKYLEIRRRQPDGTWPITRDIFNSDLP